MDIKEVILPAKTFIESIKPREKVVIVHGHDNDSICSAAVLYKLFKNEFRTETKFLISELNSYFTGKTFLKLKKLKPAHTIIVDIGNIPVEIVTKMRGISRVLIVDHHTPKGYAKVSYVNPRIFDRESYLPASYLCYKIYEAFSDPKEVAWIAGIGTLADMGLENCQDLFEKIKTQYRELVDEIENKDDILMEKSLLGRLTKIVGSAMEVKDVAGAVFSLKVLTEAKKYKNVENHKTLTRYYKLVESEFKKIETDFNKNKKIIDSMILYEIKSKLKLKSAFANYLVRMFEDKILVVYQKEGGFFNISLRRGKEVNVDLDSLAREASFGIEEASGGGHPSAAGIRVSVKQIKSLMENLRLKMKLESKKS